MNAECWIRYAHRRTRTSEPRTRVLDVDLAGWVMEAEVYPGEYGDDIFPVVDVCHVEVRVDVCREGLVTDLRDWGTGVIMGVIMGVVVGV
jgi:hypothetical protein